MNRHSSAPAYTRTAISLHWLVAVLVFAGFGLGLLMVPLPFSPAKLKYYSWHKWLGVTVFLLFWLRLFWRWRHPPPPPLAVGWQLSAAKLGHALLYLLMFLTPISGWLFSSSTGVQTVYLGLVPLPDLIGRDAGLKDLCKAVHYTCSMSMAAVVVVHLAAAFKHHWFDRDQTLRRMLRWS